MKVIRATFPNSQLTPEAVEVFLSEWAVIVAEVGWDTFHIALTKAIRNSEFFPTIALIRKHAGLGQEQLDAAECAVAWERAKVYAKGMDDTRCIIGRDEDGNVKYKPEPESPGERIMYAIEQVGGAHAIMQISRSFNVEKERFMRRDFNAAYLSYRSHEIVSARLALHASSSAETKLLTQ